MVMQTASQLHTVKQDLWDPTTSYQAHPGMPENVTLLRDAEWTSGLTKVMIYPTCTNITLKDCSPCCSDTGL